MQKFTEASLRLAVFNYANAANLELIIPNFTPRGWMECDVYGITKAGHTVEFEIKTSRADFMKDSAKARGYSADKGKTKHDLLGDPDSTKGPRRFFFVMPTELYITVADIIPPWAGVISVRNIFNTPKVVKQPVVRSKALKASDKEIARARQTMYWRYWYLQLKLARSCGLEEWPGADEELSEEERLLNICALTDDEN